MARKTLATRQKLVFRLPAARPGNSFAVTPSQRKVVSRGKNPQASPRVAKIPLVGQMGEEEDSQ